MKIFWWIIGSLFGLFLCYILFLTVVSYIISTKKEYDKDSRFYRIVLNSITGIVLKVARIHVTINGIEKLPKPSESRFLMVCNHISKWDPIIGWYVFRAFDPAFISKPENFKVPWFGRIIRRCCFMPIDRENPRNAAKTISRAAKLLTDDEVSVAVYPEGTRSKTGDMLPFHNAVFKVALKANVPLVISSIQGTEHIYKNFPLHRSDVVIDILEVIPAEEVQSQRTGELGDHSWKLIHDTISKK